MRATTVGDRVKALRIAHGMKPSELAKRVGISHPSLFNIEAGLTKKLRGDTLAGLCRVLHVPPDVILHGRGANTIESVLHESELLAIWRELDNEHREHMLALARALAHRRAKASATN
jgi:transcriptional regulator with XRE-family HTH domain